MTDRSLAARGPRSVNRITDPKALRALAHPIRLALIGLLRSEGPLTATRAAQLLGESSGSCSFHLRQLAKYGLAEEAAGGHGRERPWQATAMFTDVPEIADTPEFAAASGLFRSVLADRYFDALMRWLEARADEPAQWQRAALFGDRLLYLTADELTGLGKAIDDYIDRYVDRTSQPGLRPEGARQVTFLRLAFPTSSARPSGQADTGEADTGRVGESAHGDAR